MFILNIFLCLKKKADFATSQRSNGVGISLISECVCNGYIVTYNCSIFGGGNTIWNGSAFNCPSNSDSSNNQILLRHSGFGTASNSMGTCNGGAITGEGVRSEGGFFTSILNVTVSPNVVGQQVSCYHENGSVEILVGTATIELSSAGKLLLLLLLLLLLYYIYYMQISIIIIHVYINIQKTCHHRVISF